MLVLIEGEPQVTDILCGKDKTYIRHEGNRLFRQLVLEHIVEYENSNKNGKMNVTKKIVATVQSKYNSRFLLHIPASTTSTSISTSTTSGSSIEQQQEVDGGNTTKTSTTKKVWKVISDQQARDKTSHALRFALKAAHAHIAASASSTVAGAGVSSQSESSIAEAAVVRVPSAITSPMMTTTTTNASADTMMIITSRKFYQHQHQEPQQQQQQDHQQQHQHQHQHQQQKYELEQDSSNNIPISSTSGVVSQPVTTRTVSNGSNNSATTNHNIVHALSKEGELICSKPTGIRTATTNTTNSSSSTSTNQLPLMHLADVATALFMDSNTVANTITTMNTITSTTTKGMLYHQQQTQKQPHLHHLHLQQNQQHQHLVHQKYEQQPLVVHRAEI